jgi:hypothetical protein
VLDDPHAMAPCFGCGISRRLLRHPSPISINGSEACETFLYVFKTDPSRQGCPTGGLQPALTGPPFAPCVPKNLPSSQPPGPRRLGFGAAIRIGAFKWKARATKCCLNHAMQLAGAGVTGGAPEAQMWILPPRKGSFYRSPTLTRISSSTGQTQNSSSLLSVGTSTCSWLGQGGHTRRSFSTITSCS